MPYVGTLHLFTKNRDTGTWEEESLIEPNGPSPYLFFGYSLAMSDEKVVAGAFRDNNQNGTYAGAIYFLFPPPYPYPIEGN